MQNYKTSWRKLCENLHDLGFGNEGSDMTPKTWSMKEKNWQTGALLKLKSLPHERYCPENKKTSPTLGEAICRIHIS